MASLDCAGFSFIYPENWKILEESSDAGPGHRSEVTLESPDGGLFTLMAPLMGSPLETLLEQASQAMLGEYDELEQEPLADCQLPTEAVGCDHRFYYLDLLITCRTIAFRHRGQSFVAQLQAEDRLFERIEPVYRAMLISLIRGAPDTQ
jgi:hypothetical protein